VRRADNFIAFVCRSSRNSGSVNFLEPYGTVQACNGTAFTAENNLSLLCIAQRITFKCLNGLSQLYNFSVIKIFCSPLRNSSTNSSEFTLKDYILPIFKICTFVNKV